MKLNLKKIQEIYGNSAIYEIEDHLDIIVNNMNYLVSLKFNNVYSILETNPYMFLYDNNRFKEKINNLIQKLGVEYIEKLDNDISLWGEIYD